MAAMTVRANRQCFIEIPRRMRQACTMRGEYPAITAWHPLCRQGSAIKRPEMAPAVPAACRHPAPEKRPLRPQPPWCHGASPAARLQRVVHVELDRVRVMRKRCTFPSSARCRRRGMLSENTPPLVRKARSLSRAPAPDPGCGTRWDQFVLPGGRWYRSLVAASPGWDLVLHAVQAPSAVPRSTDRGWPGIGEARLDAAAQGLATGMRIEAERLREL